jgi:hypothetical protein
VGIGIHTEIEAVLDPLFMLEEVIETLSKSSNLVGPDTRRNVGRLLHVFLAALKVLGQAANACLVQQSESNLLPYTKQTVQSNH